MSTRNSYSMVVRLLIAFVAIAAATACGSEMLRTGRAPVYLVVSDVSAQQGGGAQQSGSFLLSDVVTLVEVQANGVTTNVPTYFNDNGSATIRVVPKNPDAVVTPINDVTLTRYHVDFRRSDGRNTPGVDVPYSFDGGLSVTIPTGGSSDVSFLLVRHQAKLEPPLLNMSSFGGQGFISTIAEVTFYGHDGNGNEVTTTARINVQFGDFGDK